MPIEIRELHIRVNVNTPQHEAPAQAGASPSAISGNGAAGAGDEEIIAACVEKVMEILQNKTER
jgi:hypothetical protein